MNAEYEIGWDSTRESALGWVSEIAMMQKKAVSCSVK